MDTAAQIAARYGATVAPGVVVQRLPTGVSSRPYPVWEGNKLVYPDWKAEAERSKLAGIRRSHAARKRGMAQDQALMARLVEMLGAGMRPPAIAAATGLKPDQVYRLLHQAGHRVPRDAAQVQQSVQRMNDHRRASVAAVDGVRAAQIRALVAQGADVVRIAAEVGLTDGSWLRRIIRRACPEFVFGRGPKLAGAGMTQRRAAQLDHIRRLVAEGVAVEAIGAAIGVGNSRHLTRLIRAAVPGFRFRDRQALIRDLAAEGAGVEAIGAAIGVRDVKHLRRVIREAVPGFDFDRDKPASGLAGRDAEVARLYPGMTRAAVAERLGLTLPQVIAALMRARRAGLLAAGPDRRAQAKAGDRVLDLHARGLSAEAIARECGLGRKAVALRLRAAGERALGDRFKAAQDRLAELPALVAGGLSTAAIAAHWGRKVSYVHSLACKHGIALGRAASPAVAVRRERVREMYLAGETHARMLAVLGCHASTLSDDIKALGLSGGSGHRKRGSQRKAAADAERRAA